MVVDLFWADPTYLHTKSTQLLIVNNWNIISANFVEVTNRGAYLYFMGASIYPSVRLRLCVWRTACTT